MKFSTKTYNVLIEWNGKWPLLPVLFNEDELIKAGGDPTASPKFLVSWLFLNIELHYGS
jgi:hypothetical protein